MQAISPGSRSASGALGRRMDSDLEGVAAPLCCDPVQGQVGLAVSEPVVAPLALRNHRLSVLLRRS
jgi:hypothetical protein